MTIVVEGKHLTRTFGPVVALDGISLSIRSGERLALVGHNGAGKTTLIKLILGLLAPSDGKLSVLGLPPGAEATRAACAYLPENLAFHGVLSGREQLRFFAKLKGESGEIDTLLDRVGLKDAKDRRISTYSKGMRQRLGLAQLLLGQPRLVILDEPTTGLDPVSRHQFYEIVSELARDGAAIIQTSHVLTELEARTDRIVILRHGKIVADGSLTELRRDANLPIRFRVQIAQGKKKQVLEKLGGREINGKAVELSTDPADKMNRLRAIGGQGTDIDDVDILQPSLEDLYLHYSNQPVSGGQNQ